jgi:hypothetical protein
MSFRETGFRRNAGPARTPRADCAHFGEKLGLYFSPMSGTPNTADPWIEKARLRLAECGAENRRLGGDEDSPRRLKLAQRSERYQSLIDYLEGRPKERVVREPSTEVTLVAIEAELMALKEQLLKGAAGLVRDRSLIKELKQRWGRAVDAHMTRLEAQGRKERLPILDWSFPVPPQTAEPFEREVHKVIRSLGL